MIRIHRLGSRYVKELQFKPCVEVRGLSAQYLSRKRRELSEIADFRLLEGHKCELRRKRPFRVKRELVKHTLFTVDY